MNSIVSTGYSRKIVIMCVKWNLFSKSQFLETHCLLFCSDIRTFLLPGQCGDDEEAIDRLVAASSESYVRNSTPQEQSREVCRSVATHKCVALATV